MVRTVIIFVGAMLVSLAAWSQEYFDDRFTPGYDLLAEGRFDEALASFNELKTDLPDSALVDYSIASTHYSRALSIEDPEQKETKLAGLFKAKEGFLELANLPDEFLKKNAPYAAANVSAQMAKMFDPEAEYSPRVEGLKAAIGEYDEVIRLYPEFQEARQNRDHLNYLLKQMLQDPPPQQEDQDQGEGGEDQNEGEEQNEGDDQKESGEEEDEQEEGEEDNSEGDQNSDDPDAENNPEPGEEPEEQSSDNTRTPEEANIEAILDSLEEVNKEEQKNLRRSKRLPQIKGGKWW